MHHLGTRAVTRLSFLRAGAAAVAGAPILAAAPAAARFGPAPVGDDIAWIQLLATAELVNLALLDRAADVPGLTGRDRARVRAWRAADAEHLKRLRYPLQDEAPRKDDFEIVLPRGALASRRAFADAAIALKQLVVGAALDGSAFAKDSGTRLLLARIAAGESEQLEGLQRLGGRPPRAGALPASLDLQAAGTRLDAYLVSTVPS